MPAYPHPQSPELQQAGAEAFRGLLAGDGTITDRALHDLSAEELTCLWETAMLLADTCRMAARCNP